MMAKNQNRYLREIKTVIFLTIASAVIAFNLKSFVNTGGLFPGGLSGVTILLQEIAQRFLGMDVPYSFIYLPLNLLPAYIGIRYISPRFTFYSFYVVVLSGVLTDIFPAVTITYDTLLISIFGGIINGTCMSICLINGASGGGTDFISIFFSEKKGVDAWSYILMGNVVVLITAGILFGFDRALYSIIYQYASTQVVRMLDPDGRRSTLFIVTGRESAGGVCAVIQDTHHSATLIEGVGLYNGEPCVMVYSVVENSQVRAIAQRVRETDPRAFVNVVHTQRLVGRFYRRPRD